MNRYTLFALVTVLVTGCDQGTKAWARSAVEFERGRLDVIDGLFSIVHWENTGMAFSMLTDVEHAMLVFYAFTVIAAGVLIYMVRQLRDDEHLQVVALGVLMSGALGNGIGRFTKQSVTDFLLVYGGRPPGLRDWLQAHFGTYYWPAFNVADACIFVGLSLFVIDWLFIRSDPTELEPDPPARMLEP